MMSLGQRERERVCVLRVCEGGKKEKKTEGCWEFLSKRRGKKDERDGQETEKCLFLIKSRDGERLSGSSAVFGLIWQLLFQASVPPLVCLHISTACLMFYTPC